MSTEIETTPQVELAAGQTTEQSQEKPKVEIKKREKSLLDQFLASLSSVKFGIAMLVILMVFSAIGTFVVQLGTSDFPKFVASLTPAEKQIYEILGFFDIYHTWYFNLLLLVLSLNIILASIDRAPGHWHFFTRPSAAISESSARHQQYNNALKLPASAYTPELVSRIKDVSRSTLIPRWAAIFGPLAGLLSRLSSFRMRVTEGKDGSTTVFVERGVWNRLAFCAVHVSLLMILLGWFIGNKWGQKGFIQFAPGEVTEVFFSLGSDDDELKKFKLPFGMQCLDIQQELIDSSKPELTPQNTLDWHTVVLFSKDGQKFKGDVHLNEPVDFGGYRFFQSSFDPMNTARHVVIQFVPKDGQGETQEVTIKRNGTAEVPGVGTVSFKDFYPNFSMDPKSGKPFSQSGDYERPAGEVNVTLMDGTTKSVIAFPQAMLDAIKEQQSQMPVAGTLLEASNIGNYKVVLKDFEKVSRAHTLQVQYDPGVDTVYLGFLTLCLFLITVFFFSHERIWVLIKPGQNDLHLFFAGNTNRNRPAFELRFQKLLSEFEKKDK
jgi:cytochrome c biogenesis protein